MGKTMPTKTNKPGDPQGSLLQHVPHGMYLPRHLVVEGPSSPTVTGPTEKPPECPLCLLLRYSAAMAAEYQLPLTASGLLVMFTIVILFQ